MRAPGAWWGLGCSPNTPSAANWGGHLPPCGGAQGHLLTACRRRISLGGSHRRTQCLRQGDRQIQREKEKVKWEVEAGSERERMRDRAGAEAGLRAGSSGAVGTDLGHWSGEGGWPSWEGARGGVGIPAQISLGWAPGPEAHQASPRCDISHTWESPLRRSSLGMGKGKGEKKVSDSGLGPGAAASLRCPRTRLSHRGVPWGVCPACPSWKAVLPFPPPRPPQDSGGGSEHKAVANDLKNKQKNR